MKLFGRQEPQVNKKPGKPRRKLDSKKVNWKHSDLKDAFTPIKRRIDMAHMLKYLTLGVLSAMGVILLVIFTDLYFWGSVVFNSYRKFVAIFLGRGSVYSNACPCDWLD